MGNKQSSPENDIKEIDTEIEAIVNNLKKCKPFTSSTIFTENQKHVEELKTELTALHKCINDIRETSGSKDVNVLSSIKSYTKEINTETQSIINNLERCKPFTSSTILTENQRHLEELKTKLTAIHKCISEIRETLISKDVKELSTIKSNTNKLYQMEKEKERTYNLTELVQEELFIWQFKCTDLKQKLLRLRQDFGKKEILIKELEDTVNNQSTAGKVECDKLKAEHVKEVMKHKVEIHSLKDQLTKLKIENNSNKRCCDDLKEKFDDKQAELERERNKYDNEINRFSNLRNIISSDLRQSKKEFKHEENLRKEAEKNVLLLQKQILELQDCQIKLTTCQKEFETEKSDKQEEINKLEYLEKELNEIKTEKRMETLRYQTQISAARDNLFTSRKDCRRQATLRESTEKELALLKEQIRDVRMLEEKLKNCRENLEIERKAKQKEIKTVEELEFKNTKVEKEILKYKQETGELVNKLNKVQKNFDKIKNDCSQQEHLRKTAESKVFLLEKQTAALNSLGETLKEYFQKNLDEEAKSNQDESDKLEVVTQAKTVSSTLSDRKKANQEYTSLEQLRKNNKLIKLLKRHLEVLKIPLEQIRGNSSSQNVVVSCIQNSTKDSTVDETLITDDPGPTLVTTNSEPAKNERFCSNEQQELDKLHKQLESLLHSI